MTIDEYYRKLCDHLLNVHDKYLKQHIGINSTPEEYDLDVRSYCVLCHAAFEDYVEFVAISVLSGSIDKFVMNKSVNLSLLTLFHFVIQADPKFITEPEDDLTKIQIVRVYDYIRVHSEKLKKIFSQSVADNHGVSIKYLKKLLLPIAIDIPNDINLLNSLVQLENVRGSYAHKFIDRKTAYRSIAPEDALKYVKDCLMIFDLIKQSANKCLD